MAPPPAASSPPPPSPDHIQNAFLRLNINMHVLVETQNRGTSHAHLALKYIAKYINIAKQPLGALSHDSDSDEPPPLLSSSDTDDDELALPYMDDSAEEPLP